MRRRGRRPPPAVVVRQTRSAGAGPRPRHVSGAASNGDDNLSQIEHGSRFDDISGRSSRACRLEALISPLNEDRAADKDHPTLWLILPDQPRRLKTIETRHHDVHRHHLGAQRRGLFHRLLAAGGTAHNLNAPVDGERHLRRLDEIRVVINNENADLLLLWSYHRLIPLTEKSIHEPAPLTRTYSRSPSLMRSTRPAASAASSEWSRRGRSGSSR